MTNEDLDWWERVGFADCIALVEESNSLPSAADLDAVAEEQRIKEQTE